MGYRPFRRTDEEFVICTTDKANQYIEETRAQSDRELKQKVERAMSRVPGRWESENGENDIEEPVRTRDKVCISLCAVSFTLALTVTNISLNSF